MSRYTRPGGRYTPGKVYNSRTEWKPKPKIDASLHDDDNSKNLKQFGEKSQKDDEKEPKNFRDTLISLDADNPKKVKNIGEKSQKDDENDLAYDMKDFKQTLMSLDADDDSKKVKNDVDNERLNHPGFDICRKKVSSVIKLKAPLHVMNRERRKQSMKGQNIVNLRPGMVLLKGYISSADQINIVKTCRDLGISNGGFYQPRYNSGAQLHLKMMCLGQNWDPESSEYSEIRKFDNAKPPGIPEKFRDMVEKAIHDSNEFIGRNFSGLNEGKVVPNMSPDICIVNFYSQTGRLGLHQDKDESEKSLKKGLPVVSFSIGDSAEFKYGETRAEDEAEKVTLESGDVLIFGGKSRLIYHGVASINPGTAPTSLIEATDMLPGRLNLTFRMY